MNAPIPFDYTPFTGHDIDPHPGDVAEDAMVQAAMNKWDGTATGQFPGDHDAHMYAYDEWKYPSHNVCYHGMMVEGLEPCDECAADAASYNLIADRSIEEVW